MKRLNSKLSYRHCRDLGVAADYCIIYQRGETVPHKAIATCHPSAIPLLKRDGLRKHLDLIKLAR